MHHLNCQVTPCGLAKPRNDPADQVLSRTARTTTYSSCATQDLVGPPLIRHGCTREPDDALESIDTLAGLRCGGMVDDTGVAVLVKLRADPLRRPRL
jgi:hypothetical protein